MSRTVVHNRRPDVINLPFSIDELLQEERREQRSRLKNTVTARHLGELLGKSRHWVSDNLGAWEHAGLIRYVGEKDEYGISRRAYKAPAYELLAGGKVNGEEPAAVGLLRALLKDIQKTAAKEGDKQPRRQGGKKSNRNRSGRKKPSPKSLGKGSRKHARVKSWLLCTDK